MLVIGSGKTTVTDNPPSKKPNTNGLPTKTFTFVYAKPSFPGTIVAGIFQEYKSDEAGMDLHVFFKPTHQTLAPEYTTTAVQEFTYFITLYGTPLSQKLNVVELPGDTVPYAWAPEIAGLAGPSITEKTNYRLLANAIAHQWWGVSVSPATKDDWWLIDGFSRYSEAMYVENAAGAAGLEEAVKDMSVGALAYDTVPLSSASKLDPFSTEFQSLVTDKGAMILHMLRWVLGEDKYYKTMREFAETYAGKSATMDDFRAIAEKYYGEQLTWFFSQWLDSTGAPEFKVKYTTYRLGSNKGFRVTGEISQDLDLFRMPVDLRIDTDGKTEDKKLEVVGTNSTFTVETFGRPRRIAVDPDHHVLTNSSDVKLRSSILRGRRCSSRATCPARSPSSTRRSTSTRTAPWPTTASRKSSSCRETTSPRRTPTALPSTATASPAGPKSGAISNWARSSTSPASASAPSTNTARPSRPTTIPSPPSKKRGSIWRKPTSGRRTKNKGVEDVAGSDFSRSLRRFPKPWPSSLALGRTAAPHRCKTSRA